MRRTNVRQHDPKKPKPKGIGLNGNALSKQQETRVAKRTGGLRTPASGSLPFAKGDVDGSITLIECKTTGKKSLRIEQKWLAKISREAALKHRTPALTISFPDMADDVDQDWVMIPVGFFRSLLDRDDE